jgi:hypothetical protein
VQLKSALKPNLLRVVRALTKCEIYLPGCFATAVKHKAVHWFQPDGIVPKTGPGWVTHTYTTERSSGMLVDTLCGGANPEQSIMLSVVKGEQAQLSRLESPGDYGIRKGGIVDNPNQAPSYMSKTPEVVMQDKAPIKKVFTPEELVQLHAFFLDQKDFLPSYRRQDQPSPEGVTYKRALLNGTLFRSMNAERNLKSSNSCVRVKWLSPNRQQAHYSYGRLNYIVRMSVSADIREEYALANVTYLEDLDEANSELCDQGKLRRLRENPNLNWNKKPFIWFDSIVPSNVIFAPCPPDHTLFVLIEPNTQNQ